MPYWSSVSLLPLEHPDVKNPKLGTKRSPCLLGSERYYTVDGKLPDKKMFFDELSDIFKTKDGYVRLHTNFPQYVPLVSLK